MGESKRRKEAEAKGLIVIPGGKEPVRQVRRYRTVQLDIPMELYDLVLKLYEVAHDLTDDAPRGHDAWWELIVGKGAMVIDSHIQSLVQAKLAAEIKAEKDKPTIERINAETDPARKAELLAQIQEIIANADSGDSGQDRGGEGHDSPAALGAVGLSHPEIQPATQGGSPDEVPKDPGSDPDQTGP